MNDVRKENAMDVCEEFSQLSRRGFLRGGLRMGAGLFAVASTPTWLPRVALAESHQGGRDVLVTIFLRGGWDALTVCAPFGDPDYAPRRPNLAVAPPDAHSARRGLDLDGFFAFAPAMEPLLPLYQSEELVMIQACGLETPTRSHFNAMHFMEVGRDDALGEFTGWLGRHLASTPPMVADSSLRAVATMPNLPRQLSGAPAASPIPDFKTFGLFGEASTEAQRLGALREMYLHAPQEQLHPSAQTFKTLDLLAEIDFTGYQPAGGVSYPQHDLGRALRSSAALIKAEIGVEVVSVDHSDWDTHGRQDPFGGFMNRLMSELSGALSAFYTDLHESPNPPRVSIVVLSEFGRNVFENGSGGTDHGHGGLMMVLGPNVRGGRVVGEWPGLGVHQLYEGQDLAITTDYRDVLGEVLRERIGHPDPASVFADPSYVARPVGIF